MNDPLTRRLLGLIVLLAVLFGLTWLLPTAHNASNADAPAATLPLNSAPAPAAQASVAAPPVAQATPAPQLPANVPVEVSAMPGQNVAPPSHSMPPPAAMPAPVAAAPVNPPLPRPAPKPAVVAAPLPTARPPTPAPPVTVAAAAPAAGGRSWFVQVGSFSEQGRAQTTLALLQNIGYRGLSEHITTAAGASLYRVRLGPYASEAAARQTFDKVSHQGYPQARVLSEVVAAN